MLVVRLCSSLCWLCLVLKGGVIVVFFGEEVVGIGLECNDVVGCGEGVDFVMVD